MRGATRDTETVTLTLTPISIHAPREGSDRIITASALYHIHFNPRSP